MKYLLLFILMGCVLAACTPSGSAGENATSNDTLLSPFTILNVTEPVENDSMEENMSEPEPEVIVEPEPEEPEEPSTPVPTKTIQEGERISLKENIAVDPDGDSITYSFSEPFDNDGEWQTEIGDAGEYLVDITATDGQLTSVLQVRIIVNATNARPIISNFEDIQVSEGERIKLEPEVTDPDGDDVELTVSGWMTDFIYTTDFSDAGVHQVTLTADDGFFAVEETILVTVRNSNRPPSLSSLDDITVQEGQEVVIEPSARDGDGDTLTFSYTAPINAGGSWQTEVGDAGEYEVTVMVSDGIDNVRESLMVTVTALNNAPTISIASTLTVQEGDTIELEPEVEDADNDEVQLSYSGWMSSATRTTDFGDAGEYEVTITADDGTTSVSETIEITVLDVNRPPVFLDDIFEE